MPKKLKIWKKKKIIIIINQWEKINNQPSIHLGLFRFLFYFFFLFVSLTHTNVVAKIRHLVTSKWLLCIINASYVKGGDCYFYFKNECEMVFTSRKSVRQNGCLCVGVDFILVLCHVILKYISYHCMQFFSFFFFDLLCVTWVDTVCHKCK